jgi:DNA-binding winged helix-turn-helix (wHTH) protein/tRNA A-37 threonylcarbamoyl transferase component Bud32
MPQTFSARPSVVRFAPFDLDLRTGELLKDGARTSLQEHPFEILRLLIERPGEVVTRDELRARLWPNGTIVDFEHGLNSAMKRLRDALGDDAERPTYVETVRRRGYRFIATVRTLSTSSQPRDSELRLVTADHRAPRAQESIPIGGYRLIEKIGAGAMGQVFLAEDRLLKRHVALKFLPPDFAADAGRLARFQREAEVLASLSHPNIAAIHGLGEAEGRRCLVLEFVDGESLAQRITRGPMPVPEALEVCRQIADALEAAHQKGFVHRDLNPGNVKITADGRVKLLDFGLAKALAGHPPAGTARGERVLSDSGIIVGTARYMSPEQAEGRPVDQRADIWSFGCVLFECLAGKPPFPGHSAAAILSAILRGDPEWHRLPDTVPHPVRTLIEKCLRKDQARRLRDIADVRIEMMDAISAPDDARRGAWAAALGFARRAGPAGAALLGLGAVIGVMAARACG